MTTSQVVLITGAGSGIGRAVAESLAIAGHAVYAGMRSIEKRNKTRADELNAFALERQVDLRVIELDVLSEASCRAAVDQILHERRFIDVVVNNAGMLMTGMTEAFTPEQMLQIFDTNAVSWLRVNRAALPAMRRRRRGLLVYIGSTTASLFEPFIGPYVASKAAGEALAEVMSFEVSPFGIESVIVVPGAFTQGTEHFAHAHGPDNIAVAVQYGELNELAASMGARLNAVDAANGARLGVSAVGDAVRRILELPHGERPARVVVDAQNKGIEELNSLHRAKQTTFFEKMGIGHLISVAQAAR